MCLLKRLALSSLLALSVCAQPAHAQFGGIKIPKGIKIPGLPNLPGVPDIKIPGLETLFKEEEPVSTSIKDARYEIDFLDDYNPASFRSLQALKRGPHGGWLLRPGLYSGDIRTYCLHAGTYGPTHGSGYLYAPLKGKRSGMIKAILHNSADHPELPQHDVQSLIWAIEARAKFDNLPSNLQKTASTLLSEQDILDLKGISLNYITDQMQGQAFDKLSTALRPVYEAQNNLRGMLTQATTPVYSQLEHAAVLLGDPPKEKNDRDIPRGRWTLHPGGFFVRYMPSSYSRTTLQIYVPKHYIIKRDAKGRIASVMSSTGRGVETTYNDAVQPLATSANGFQGYSFASIRFVKPAAISDDTPSTEHKNVGWTFAGTLTGRNVQVGSAMNYPGSDARLRADVDLLRQMDDFRKSQEKNKQTKGDASNCVDLANYRAGIKDALGKDGTPETLDFLTNAWQSEMAQWASGTQTSASDANPDDTEFDPSDDVATPGDTGRQRLGQSEVPSDSKPYITCTIKKWENIIPGVVGWPEHSSLNGVQAESVQREVDDGWAVNLTAVVTVEARNEGDKDAPASTLSIMLNKDAHTAQIAAVPVRALRSGESVILPVKLTFHQDWNFFGPAAITAADGLSAASLDDDEDAPSEHLILLADPRPDRVVDKIFKTRAEANKYVTDAGFVKDALFGFYPVGTAKYLECDKVCTLSIRSRRDGKLKDAHDYRQDAIVVPYPRTKEHPTGGWAVAFQGTPTFGEPNPKYFEDWAPFMNYVHWWHQTADY